MCAQEVETEHASVRVQEADETDCPKISSGLNDLPTWMEVQKAHKEWVCDGRLINYDENPKLNRKSAHAIVRFLLPRVDIKGELKMKDINSMKVCMKWLGEVKRGMTWDEHMHAAAEEKMVAYEEMWRADNENLAVGAAPLFELGSV